MTKRIVNMTPEQRERKRERQRRENMTPEQRERQRQRQRIENMTPEQRERHRRVQRERRRERNMTPEQIERKRERARKWRRQVALKLFESDPSAMRIRHRNDPTALKMIALMTHESTPEAEREVARQMLRNRRRAA